MHGSESQEDDTQRCNQELPDDVKRNLALNKYWDSPGLTELAVPARRIFGKGEMADLTRAFRWDQTRIGSIDRWPDCLVTTVNTILETRHPMFLWWGSELIQFYNDAYSLSIGADKHPKALGQAGAECWPEIWHIIGPQIMAVMNQGESSWHEDQLVPIYRNRQLQDVYWTYSYSPVRDATGTIRGTLVTCSETTERVVATEALRNSENKHSFMLELLKEQRETSNAEAMMRSAASAMGRYLNVDRVGFFSVSDDALNFLEGWTAGRIPLLTGNFPAAGIGTRYLKEVQAGKTLGIQNARIDSLTSDSQFGEIGTVSLVETPIIRNGQWHAGLYVNHSEVRQWKPSEIDLIRDVANQTWDAVERARAQAAHAAVAEQLNQVLEATNDAIVCLDHRWRITYLNQRAREILAPSGEILGKDYWESLPGQPSSHIEHYRVAMEERRAGEFEAFFPEPLNLWAHVTAQPARDGIVLFIRNVTEQKRATAALIRAEKLAAVGRLASSIAHEINNPLAAVTNLLYLSNTGEASPEVKKYLALAEQELARVTNIATQTLRFHRQPDKPREATLSEILDSVLALFHGRIGDARVKIDTQYRTEGRITALDGDLRQVFVNLIANALDSTQPGGKITIRVREATDWVSGKFGVRVLVADTGHGMSRETRRLIFEPFFTTKGSLGTGLGLWVSAEVLRRHNSKVQVRSKEGMYQHGTVFSIYFPLHENA